MNSDKSFYEERISELFYYDMATDSIKMHGSPSFDNVSFKEFCEGYTSITHWIIPIHE